MSKGIRRSVIGQPFEAKRVIVAACAAVAMVMGAMSVNSTTSSANDNTKGHISSLVSTEAPNKTSQPVRSPDLTSKHTIEAHTFLQQPAAPLFSPTSKTTKINKPTKDVLNQVLATVNPVLFMTEIVQMQQPVQPATADGQPATTGTGSTSDTTTSGSDGTSTSSGTSDTNTSSTSTDSGTSKNTDPTAPSDSSNPQSQSLSASQSTDTAPAPTTP